MNRRGFLASILAAGMAPAICKAQSLMPVFARSESGLLLPTVPEGGIITLYDALGSILATIPMSGPITALSGNAPIVRSGTYHSATLDIPGLGRRDMSGLVFNSKTLVMGNTMNMNISLG